MGEGDLMNTKKKGLYYIILVALHVLAFGIYLYLGNTIKLDGVNSLDEWNIAAIQTAIFVVTVGSFINGALGRILLDSYKIALIFQTVVTLFLLFVWNLTEMQIIIIASVLLFLNLSLGYIVAGVAGRIKKRNK